jgi:hypothetical protein
MKRNIFLLLSILTVLSFTSCNKDEGKGGTAVIQGKVYIIVHNDDDFNLSTDTILAAKKDVFIIYGNDTYTGDDVETGKDGTYQFKYLTAGRYTVYAYSELASGEKVAVSKTIEVGRGETADVDDIYIEEGKANGTSMIRGQIYCTYFDGNGDDVATGWAFEQRVYIQRLGENFYFDDTRVGSGGYYYFQKLIPDTYIIYTFTQSDDEIPSPVSDTVTVDSTGVIYNADLLSIRLKA